MKSFFKWVLRVLLIGICISFIYVGWDTEVISKDDIWTNDMKMHDLKKNEIFYGTFFFSVDGLAPIWIKDISLYAEDGKELVDYEIYVFYDETQKGIHPSGGHYDRKQFFVDFSLGLNKIENIDKLKEKNFEVVALTSQNKCRNVICEITYKVWGVFDKKVTSRLLTL